MFLESIKDVPNILIRNLAYHLYLLTLLLPEVLCTDIVRKISVCMYHRKRFIHLFAQVLNSSIHLIREFVAFNLLDFLFLLEENQICTHFLDFNLELLHQLFIRLTFMIDLHYLLYLEFFWELRLLLLKVLHHFVRNNAFASDLNEFLLQDFGVLSDLSESCDVSFALEHSVL